ncbi:MAG: hypothetical protein ABEI52_03590, partial [Halobacteriaceae archaeon]
AYTDSYNSSNGDYSSTQSTNGTIVVGGSFSAGGGAVVDGNVRTGASADLSGTADINGIVYYTSGFDASGSAEYAGKEQISGIDMADAIDAAVTAKINSLEDTNNNDDTTAIESEQVNFTGSTAEYGGGTATLTAGNYYVKSLDMVDQKLVLDTSSGDIALAVDSSLTLDNSNITVKGDGKARIYVADDITLSPGSSTFVPDQRSVKLWVYGTSHATIDLTGNQGNELTFVGVIYAPSESGGSSVTIKHAEVFGSIVAGTINVEQGGAIHFDQALMNTKPLAADVATPRLTYLHVTVNNVTITSGT